MSCSQVQTETVIMKLFLPVAEKSFLADEPTDPELQDTVALVCSTLHKITMLHVKCVITTHRGGVPITHTHTHTHTHNLLPVVEGS